MLRTPCSATARAANSGQRPSAARSSVQNTPSRSTASTQEPLRSSDCTSSSAPAPAPGGAGGTAAQLVLHLVQRPGPLVGRGDGDEAAVAALGDRRPLGAGH